MPENSQSTLKNLINSLMLEMEKNDPSMKAHATRVANLCVLFLKELKRPSLEINQIYLAALLHDIGMIFIPKKISSKRDNLSQTEMAYIKKHTLISEKILSKYSILKDILPIIRYHHEAIDGSGYPDGLKGTEIPLSSKIINIVNTYDRYTANGDCGGKALSQNEALNEIQKVSGKIFDRTLVERFVKFMIHEENNGASRTDQVITDNNTSKSSNDEYAGSLKEIISDIIQQFKKHDVNFPVLPEVVKDIQEVINSPSAGVDALAAVIEKDAVISVRLIAVSNSALYRGTEKILTVKQAIPRIGAKETQSIVATIANKGLYEVKDKVFKTLMEKSWKHSLACAFASRALSEFLSLGDSEKYYFMGLVHDIGKVLILKTLADLHYKYDSMDVDEMLTEAKAVHTSFGSAILRKWGFSDEYTRMCLPHAGPTFKTSTDKEILLLNLAGNIAKKAGYGLRSTPDDIDMATLNSRILLNIEPSAVDKIVESVTKLMSDVSDIFS